MANYIDNYLRKVTSGDNVYYGYSSVKDPNDSDHVWSIKLVSGTSSETITWSNGNPSIRISSWSDKESYFTTQSSLSSTYSVGSTGSYNYISLGWSDLAGVDIYKISISEGNQLLNGNGYEVFVNPNFNNDPSIKVFGTSSYIWNHAKIGVTYSISISSSNVIETQSEKFDVYVP